MEPWVQYSISAAFFALLAVSLVINYVRGKRGRHSLPRHHDEDRDEIQEAIDRWDRTQTNAGRSQFWRF